MFIRRIDVEGEFDMLWKDVEEKKLLSYDIIESVLKCSPCQGQI